MTDRHALDLDELAAVIAAAIGHPLDELTPGEAKDVADRLRAIADATAGPGSDTIAAAAALVELRAGVT
jgi:hypothetical protein